MSSSKHDQTDLKDNPFPKDRERDPGIGKSKGAFATGEDPKSIEGENTVDGDVQNDSTYGDGETRTSSGGRINKASVNQVGLPLLNP